ncbi:hypothetical protein [Synechococcus sp. HK01-R]|uniref:hypothetical protein n=1 Tax=Synechococcus sp. HK01-R TaxID=2751171 RepID=UPI001624C8F3|nr:hypothetical protein [Synechococcus sp. HK01-R]QNG26075.1 hypothetical protein H0O21_07085 [Synechococcus sp. HK01-R]
MTHPTRRTASAQPVRITPASLLRLLLQFAGLGGLVALVLALPIVAVSLLGQAFNAGRPFRYDQQDINDQIQRQQEQRQADACRYSQSHGGPGC